MALGFFRRNTKMVVWIMVVLMGMFILSTVGASQLSKWFSPSEAERVEGTAGDSEITVGDLQSAYGDLQILGRLGLGQPKRMFLRMVSGQFRPIPGEEGLLLLLAEPQDVNGRLVGFRPISTDERTLMWVLLLREARGMGLEADGLLVDSFIYDTLGLDEAGYTSVLTTFRTDGIPEKRVREAIEGFLLVTMAAENAASGQIEPEGWLRDLFNRAATKMDVAMLELKATSFLDQVPDEQTVEAFEADIHSMYITGRKYHPNEPKNPHPMGFGYRRPARVRLEYAFIRFDDILARMTVTEDQIYDYWTANPEQFTKPVEPATTTAPAAEPVTPLFAEVKDQVRKRVRQRAATERIKALAAKLLADTQALEEQDATVGPSPLEQVAAAMVDSGVRYVAMAEPVSGKKLMTDPVLGAAFFGSGQNRAPLAALALNVEQLLPEERKSLAKAEVGKVFTRALPVGGSNSGLVVWSVVEAKPSIEPPTMDEEVRRQVTADWRLNKAFEIAQQAAQAARIRISEVGMADVAADLGAEIIEAEGLSQVAFVTGLQGDQMVRTLYQVYMFGQEKALDSMDQGFVAEAVLRFLLNRPFVQTISAVTALQPRLDVRSKQRLLDTLFEMADAAPDGETTTTAPAPAAGVRVLAMPSRASVIVAQRLKLTPAYEQEYQAARIGLAAGLAADRRVQLARRWFSTSEIVARTGYSRAGLLDQPDEEKDE